MQHALAYRGVRDYYEDWREAQIFKALGKSGATPVPRARKRR